MTAAAIVLIDTSPPSAAERTARLRGVVSSSRFIGRAIAALTVDRKQTDTLSLLQQAVGLAQSACQEQLRYGNTLRRVGEPFAYGPGGPINGHFSGTEGAVGPFDGPGPLRDDLVQVKLYDHRGMPGLAPGVVAVGPVTMGAEVIRNHALALDFDHDMGPVSAACFAALTAQALPALAAYMGLS